MCSVAAYGGHISILQWLSDPCAAAAAAAAAEGGHFTILRWLRKMDVHGMKRRAPRQVMAAISPSSDGWEKMMFV